MWAVKASCLYCGCASKNPAYKVSVLKLNPKHGLFGAMQAALPRVVNALQIQMRDFNGLIETRQTLLHLKAANRNNWISFAIAYHLNKDYDLAVQARLYYYPATVDSQYKRLGHISHHKRKGFESCLNFADIKFFE